LRGKQKKRPYFGRRGRQIVGDATERRRDKSSKNYIVPNSQKTAEEDQGETMWLRSLRVDETRARISLENARVRKKGPITKDQNAEKTHATGNVIVIKRGQRRSGKVIKASAIVKRRKQFGQKGDGLRT